MIRTSRKEKILRVLDSRFLLTANEITTKLGYLSYPYNSSKPMKLASVASLLGTMLKEGSVLRFKGIGPRGGYGYIKKV